MKFIAAIGIALLASAAHAQSAITLPEMLAVELPRGANTIGPDDSALHVLLAAARSADRTVIWDLKRKLGPGAAKVTWTAWDGMPGTGTPAATRSAYIMVLPNGMTPVGVTGDENATTGNSAVHIARDAAGRLHMVWEDGGRPGGPTGPFYRRATTVNGVLHFETGPVNIADPGPSDWNGYPALAVSGNTVQLVWQSGGIARTRRITGGTVLEPVVDTGARSEGSDIGPAIAFDSKGGLHIVTPDGIYTFSADGGRTWKSEPVPLPAGATVKTISLAVDGRGTVHIAFSAPLTKNNPVTGEAGGYWQLRTIDRGPDGAWHNPTDVLAHAPGWGKPKAADDMLADWARIAADAKGGLHLTWHGTVYSHKFEHDTSFYAWKKPGGDWQAPVALQRSDSAHGIGFSYAPTIALDGDRMLAITFYEQDLRNGSSAFDSALAIFANGRMQGQLVPVTRFVAAAAAARTPDAAIGSRFPAAAPQVWHTSDGRAGLDLLETLQMPASDGPKIVVHQWLDLTARLGNHG
ncbi:MAG TPA: hypothetical protein VMS78_07145 [Rhizomicrobium sp.]|nr:hypothetical protein [Rhizomicrobium sp.]